ncbi:hypothetical protein PanWU01x14_071480, partial [Parasponia andersonii]
MSTAAIVIRCVAHALELFSSPGSLSRFTIYFQFGSSCFNRFKERSVWLLPKSGSYLLDYPDFTSQ